MKKKIFSILLFISVFSVGMMSVMGCGGDSKGKDKSSATTQNASDNGANTSQSK